MGHLVGKDVYRQLGRKIDHLAARTPWNESLAEILRELYTPEEADLVAKMPFGLASLRRLAALTGIDEPQLEPRLDRLGDKGLVVDIEIRGTRRYAVSPLVIGIFEFTMMRTGPDLDRKKIARLFHQYMGPDGVFHAANYAHGETTPVMRTLPHEDSLRGADFVEILDYEKAREVIDRAHRFSMSLCSCRHEKHHLGRDCTAGAPMDNCSTMDYSADYLIRHGLGREVSKHEMLDNVDRSRDLGLVMNADNVQRNVSFICHCCGCCCNALAGLTDHGYPAAVLTSSFVAAANDQPCKGCNFCERACPINAISMVPDDNPASRKKMKPAIDGEYCLGCGVCAHACTTGAMRLEPRTQRVIPPESTFQRVILGALDRGNLQYLIFDNPHSGTQAFLRGLVGGFLRVPPIKRSLMSDQLRSRFLNTLEGLVRRQGKGWASEV